MKTYQKLALSLVVVAAGSYFVAKYFGIRFEEIAITITKFPATAIVFAIAAVVGQVACQSSRLWIFLRSQLRVGWWRVAASFSVGQWVNLFAPARAGDVVKIVSLNRQYKLSIAGLTGIMVADKIVDIFSLVLLIPYGGLNLVDKIRSGGGVSNSILVAAGVLVTLLVTAHLLFPKYSAKAREWILRALKSLTVLRSSSRVFWGLFFSLAAWAFEVVSINVLCGALGYELALKQLVFVLLVLNLGIAIPISVANIGTFEAAIVVGLKTFGIPMADALAIAIVHHAIQMVGVSIWAFVGLFLLRGQKK